LGGDTPPPYDPPAGAHAAPGPIVPPVPVGSSATLAPPAMLTPPASPAGGAPSSFLASRPGLRVGLGAAVANGDGPAPPPTIAPGMAMPSPTIAPGSSPFTFGSDLGPPSYAAGLDASLPPPAGGPGYPPLGSELPPPAAGPGYPPLGAGPGMAGPGMPPVGVGPGMPPVGVGPGMPPVGVGPGMPPAAGGPGHPPLGAGPGMPPLSQGRGIPPVGVGPGMPPAAGGPGHPPMGAGAGIPPLSQGRGIPPVGAGPGYPPMGGGPGYPPMGAGPGMPPIGVGPGMPPRDGAVGGVGVGPGMPLRSVGPGIPPIDDGPQYGPGSSVPDTAAPGGLGAVEYDEEDQPKRRPWLLAVIGIVVILGGIGLALLIARGLEDPAGNVAKVTRTPKAQDVPPNEDEPKTKPEEPEEPLVPVIEPVKPTKKPPTKKPGITFEQSLVQMKAKIRTQCKKLGSGPVDIDTFVDRTGGKANTPKVAQKGPVGDCALRIVKGWDFPESDEDHPVDERVTW
jgi:hypothetical protein